MKFKPFVSLSLIGAVITLSCLFFPWLLFTGLDRNPSYGAFEVSGNLYGFGFGTLNKTSAQVTVWSGEHWSTAGSDFWFGWLSVSGGFLVLISTVAFALMKAKSLLMLIPVMFVLVGGILSISAIVATAYYRPQTFVVDGQIYHYPIDIAILRAADATISISVAPWLSLAGGTTSVASIILA